jgi:flagellar hook-associated protein 1 FlgK
MADFLSTGVSGLFAFRRALDTTAHNIANVSTEGYSRQRAELMTRDAHPYGNGWIGSGVDVSTVRRVYDELISQQARTASSSFERFNAYASQTERVNNLFANTTTGLSATLQKFGNALQEVATSPASVPARQVLLSEANALVERLKSYDAQLAQFASDAETRLETEASDITSIARSLAQLNGNIAAAVGRTGQPPNDLLDQRDRLIDQLATHLDVSTVKQDDGRVNVFVGSGQPLVLDNEASELVSVTDPYDPSRHGLALRVANGPLVEITSSLTGGSLGGTLDFRSEVLDSTRNAIGRISIGIAEVINGQHAEGIDLSGNAGTDIFAVGAPQALRHSGNPSTATVSVARTDLGALTETDYILQHTSGAWELRRADNGAAVTLTGTGTALDPLVADGLEIEVSGTAQNGDRFLLRPTRSAVDGMNVLLTDPGRIAAAAPIRTAVGAANTGTGAISAGEVIDAANADLRDPVTISFPTAGTYSINGDTPVAFASGDSIEFNGWSVTITGTPAAGDTFTVADNAGGSGDNRNALALIDSFKEPVLENGTSSLDDTASRLVGSIGVATRQAQSSRDAQQIMQQDALAAQDAVSGVNLDEEAANLLRFQQAYQAAAQMIQVANTLFDSLLAATSR